MKVIDPLVSFDHLVERMNIVESIKKSDKYFCIRSAGGLCYLCLGSVKKGMLLLTNNGLEIYNLHEECSGLDISCY